MSTPDLTAIPLPAEPSSAVAGKKPAEDMRQGALKNHSVILGKEPAAASDAPPNKVHHSSASTTTSEAPPNKVHHSSASTTTSEAPPNKVHHSSASTTTSEAPPNKVHHSSASTITAAGLDGKESSQRIVDQLFKDFIAQKITSTSRGSKDIKDDKTVSRVRNSADEISKLLDMEIKSIKSSTESKDKLHDRKDQRSNSVSKQSKFIPVSGSAKENKRICDNVLASSSDTPSLSSRNKRSVSSSENKVDAAKSQSTANDNTHVVMMTVAATVSTVTVETVSPTTTASESTTQSNDPLQPPVGGSSSNVKRNMMLPVSLAKKMMQPKVLGMKLSTESLSLIQSKDRIDRDGRVWEEGEVCSTGTEGSEKDKTSDSGGDGVPSESGSIHSNSGEPKSQSSKHKRKHKHRHKKKRKKKSSKEKDMDRDRRRNKDTHDKDQEKCSTRGKSDKDTGSSKDRDTKSSQDRETRSSQDRETRSSKDREIRSSKDRDDQKVEKDQIIKEDSEKHSGKVQHRSSDQAQKDLKRKEKDSKKRERSGSRSRSPKRRRKSKSRSRSRSKSPKRHRSHSRSSSPKSHGSGRYGEWDARRYSDDHSRFRSRSRSRSKDRHRRSRDRSKSHERDRSKESNDKDLRVKIDKAKLRKIAIANALQNMKAGQGPQVDLTLAKSGGKSVEELTEFCKRISEKSKVAEANDDSSDGEAANKSDDEDTLIHHPFKVKEASSTGIVMNIRNAKQLPVLTPSEKQAQQAALRLTFPVSSGSIHRASESEWVPVVKPGPSAPVPPPAPAAQVATVAEPPVAQKSGDSIFPDVSEAQTIDIGAIISERLQAVRKLQENPYDMQALSQMHQVQQQATKWAASRHLPGQFVGSTGAQVLTQEQLIGDRRRQAWAKKTQLSHAAPVHGGIGMFLLQKMGWKQGEGLGKNNEGSREPLMLDIKVDRRGLTTAAENPRHRPPAPAAAPRAKDLSNKHPVSALMELCNRRKWGPPMFTVVSESGPDHKKNFLFKVRVNNVEYQSASPSSNKKTAKALCAAICLQEMGLLPRDAPLNI